MKNVILAVLTMVCLAIGCSSGPTEKSPAEISAEIATRLTQHSCSAELPDICVLQICEFFGNFARHENDYGTSDWWKDYLDCVVDYIYCFDEFCTPGTVLTGEDAEEYSGCAKSFKKCFCGIVGYTTVLGSDATTICRGYWPQ